MSQKYIYLNLPVNDDQMAYSFKDPIVERPEDYELTLTNFNLKSAENPTISLPLSKVQPDSNYVTYDAAVMVYVRYKTTQVIMQDDEITDYTKYKETPYDKFPENLGVLGHENDTWTDKAYGLLRKKVNEKEYVSKDGIVSTYTDKHFFTKQKDNGDIQSLDEFLDILNGAIADCFGTIAYNQYEYSRNYAIHGTSFNELKSVFTHPHNKYLALSFASYPPKYSIENGKLQLSINGYLAKWIYEFEYNYDKFNDVEHVNLMIGFSESLYKYLHSLRCKITPAEYQNIQFDSYNITKMYCNLSFTPYDIDKCYRPTTVSWKTPGRNEPEKVAINIVYGVFNHTIYGETVTENKWSDIIGICISSVALPVEPQNYSGFEYDTSKSDFNLTHKRKSLLGDGYIISSLKRIKQEDEWGKLADQLFTGTKHDILYLHYFTPDEDFKNFAYNNDNPETAQKISLQEGPPLKNFYLKFWYIDIYHNLRPIKFNSNLDSCNIRLLFTRKPDKDKEFIYPLNYDDEPLNKKINTNPFSI